MEPFGVILAALVFAAACNLDTVLLAMSYGMRGVRLSGGQGILIGGITTLVTWLSLVLGGAAAAVLPEGLAELLGGLVLVGIGLWFILDWLRRPEGEASREEARTMGSLAECVSLAAALAVNNAGVGVAAGVSGVSPGWAAAGNFLVTLAALALGRRLGDRLAGKQQYALPLSGVLLIALGAWEVLL